MSVQLWTLLGFAGWTLLTLLVGVGVVRWYRILGEGAPLTDFPGDQPHGSPRYRRAMRAHANCVENLPVYGAIVVVATAAGAGGTTLDVLAVVVLAGRILQTLVHVIFPESNLTVGLRFTFFFVQIAAMIWMGTLVAGKVGI